MHRQGFSLVELSIVLVILGLLTGGILTGQNLIRAAELRSVVTDLQKFQASAYTFRDRYMALPGDMRNATNFWGAMTNCGVASPSGTGTQTCNGDNSGAIGVGTLGSQTGEAFGFWQHLANSGLISGSYTGIAGSGSGSHSIIGTNVPSGKASNTGWFVYHSPIPVAVHFTIPYGAGVLMLGGSTATASPYTTVFKPEEVWSIDSKIDDGKPARGNVGSLNWSNGCTTAASSTDYEAEYALEATGMICHVIFRNFM